MSKHTTYKRTNAAKIETLRRREVRRFKYQGAPLIEKTVK